jgi:serine/threonine-protein kinase HipA
MKNVLAGTLQETERGYDFCYDASYLNLAGAMAVSQTLPLQADVHSSTTLHAFFDGLIPEGWLLDIAQDTWKINVRDRMALLLACCKDCIGAVSVRQEIELLP